MHVNSHELGLWRWKYAVEEQLICKHVGHGSSNDTRVIDKLSAHSETCSICRFLVHRIFLVFDEVYCVGAFDMSVDALC